MSANKTNKAAHKDPTAAAALGAAGDPFTAMLTQKRARAREDVEQFIAEARAEVPC